MERTRSSESTQSDLHSALRVLKACEKQIDAVKTPQTHKSGVYRILKDSAKDALELRA